MDVTRNEDAIARSEKRTQSYIAMLWPSASKVGFCRWLRLQSIINWSFSRASTHRFPNSRFQLDVCAVTPK
eukprot:11187937-Lingulodinium_polyedra.AAC.1